MEQILLSLHTMASVALKNDLIAIDQKEASILAGAVLEVSRHYDTLDGVSDKVMAWIGLGTAVATVYGPRVMAARLTKTKVEKTDTTAGNVTSFPGMAAQ